MVLLPSPIVQCNADPLNVTPKSWFPWLCRKFVLVNQGSRVMLYQGGEGRGIGRCVAYIRKSPLASFVSVSQA